MEYKCTSVEIEQITINITAVKLSKRKPQFTKKTPTVTQGKTKHSKSLAKKTTSKKKKRDRQKEKKTQSVEKKGTALCPRKRPKKPLTTELSSGKNRIIMFMLLHKKMLRQNRIRTYEEIILAGFQNQYLKPLRHLPNN